MKKFLFFIVCMAFFAAGCDSAKVNPDNPTPEPIVCTQEAMLCPDGSYVSRTGPNCEFAACPETSPNSSAESSGIEGYVHMGPTCPVEKYPPDPNCADKPYVEAAVTVTDAGGKQHKTQTDLLGKFRLVVPVGRYTIKVSSVNILPRCEEKQAAVTNDKFTSVDISCDTGIR
jgi:hypothetical protein